jgi:hypothetical protein
MKAKESYLNATDSQSTIRCECGAEILILPQVELMGKAIEAHATEHELREPHTAKAKATGERIRNLLIKQVLTKVAQNR